MLLWCNWIAQKSSKFLVLGSNPSRGTSKILMKEIKTNTEQREMVIKLWKASGLLDNFKPWPKSFSELVEELRNKVKQAK